MLLKFLIFVYRFSNVVCVTRSHDSLFENERYTGGGGRSAEALGFEEMWAGGESLTSINNNEDSQDDGSGRTRVDFLAEEDMTVLRPLIFVELSALMDKSGQRVGKVKPAKRKRKEDGTLFGLSLATLLEKDSHIMVETHSVPLVFQKVLGELEKRGIQEEGILRVAGNKQRVESLCAKLDHEFYTRPEVADHLIASAHVHELSTLLKRLIRLMPQPLLTSHLLHLFYQSQGVPDCLQALNLLVLLLPTEHRATLYALLTFLANVVANQQSNKMSAHNVAMIMAPSFFPPNVLVAKSGLKAELGLAVQCCRLMEAMMDAGERLWLVPNQLIRQLRIINTGGRKENNDIGGGAAVVRIDAPQFLLNSVPIALDKYSTVGDVIIR
ncbi:hypothetical protein AAG570_005960 [Ranatra chinensis]|uniref:Rho-GAP domain-containing protein n=1 Tax=Ranatra chinensis TaxID=642074 RepID=A0ABD0YKC1_9HEMI